MKLKRRKYRISGGVKWRSSLTKDDYRLPGSSRSIESSNFLYSHWQWSKFSRLFNFRVLIIFDQQSLEHKLKRTRYHVTEWCIIDDESGMIRIKGKKSFFYSYHVRRKKGSETKLFVITRDKYGIGRERRDVIWSVHRLCIPYRCINFSSFAKGSTFFHVFSLPFALFPLIRSFIYSFFFFLLLFYIPLPSFFFHDTPHR